MIARVLVVSAVAAWGSRPACAGTITFEDQGPGVKSALTYTIDGVTAAITSDTGVDFRIDDLASSGVPGSWGTRSLSPFTLLNQPAKFEVDFTGVVHGVSIRFGDFSNDIDTAWFEAYSGPNGTGTVLGSLLKVYAGELDDGQIGTFSFGSAVEIRSIRFWGVSATSFSPNSLYWDNLRFTDQVIPMPQAAGMGIGGLMLVASRRTRRRA